MKWEGLTWKTLEMINNNVLAYFEFDFNHDEEEKNQIVFDLEVEAFYNVRVSVFLKKYLEDYEKKITED